LATLSGHNKPVTAVRWSPDGRRIASGGPDGTVRLWDAATGRNVRTLAVPSLESWQGMLCWSPDSRYLAAACRDLAVRVWDLTSEDEPLTLRGHTGSHIDTVCWSPTGKFLASAERGWNGEIKIWKLDDRPAPYSFRIGRGADAPLDLSWSPDGRMFASAHRDGTVRTWDAATGQPVRTFRGHRGSVARVVWSPNGRALASGGQDASVKVWDVATGKCVADLPGRGSPLTALSWSPDGGRLIASAADHKLTLWDLATTSGRQLRQEGTGAAFSPRGDRLAVADTYVIRLVDTLTTDEVFSWSIAQVRDAVPVWSPDGTRVASTADFAVEVRDAATGQAPFPALGHTRHVNAVAWSPALSDGTPPGRQLVTATEDGTLHL
jgi:WD40 repeat protein